MKSAQRVGWLFLSFLILSSTACLQDNSQSTTSTTGAGRVGVLLTDAPAPAQTFTNIYVTITGIALLGEDENDASSTDVVLYSGSQKVDLLHLADFSELFSLAGNIPAGEYHKIRLTIDAVELVTADGSSVFPKLPANGKIDLNPRGAIVVEANQTLLIQLDVDAEKSIHIVETGKGGYNFRPVIFVDVISAGFPGKLMRRTGYIQSLDAVTGDFSLCATPAAPVVPVPVVSSVDSDDTLPCAGVSVNDASVFDNTGAPAETADLADDQRVTVIGFLTGLDDDEDGDEDVFVQLGAEVIEIGGADPWVVKRGAVGSVPADATSAFTLNLDSVKSLQAQLQTGTKVFARDGTRLTAADIAVGMEAAVDGVYDATDATLLKSSLVVLDTGTPLAQTGGVIQTIDYALREMTVATSTGDVIVAASEQTTIFLFSKTGAVTGVTQILFGALKATQNVTVFGVTDTGGVFHASVILAEAL